MPARKVNEYGSIIIKESIIAKIVSNAALETYGIVGMAAKSAKDGIFEKLKLENSSKGILVNIDENQDINIEVSVIMEYGVRIAIVAENIIDKIKYNIEQKTGLKVNSVNIKVHGIRV